MMTDLEGGAAHRTRGRRRFVVAVIVAIVLVVAVAAVAVALRVEASRILDRAEKQHQKGDCAAAVKTLSDLGGRHRLSAWDIRRDAGEQRSACEVLAEAKKSGSYDQKALASYLDHPGARWAGAGIKRAEVLLGLAGSSEGSARDPEAALKQLDETLAEAPKEAKAARELVETYLGRFSKKGYSRPATDEFGYVDEKAAAQVCADRDELTEVQKGDWKRPELTEPIAKTAELADDWLLACAGAKAAIEKSWDEARALYESYLKTYASEPGAEQARQGRDQVVAQIEHKQDRANAVARANRPADGSNLGACRDGRCQVRVSPGEVITFGGPGGPYQVRADDIAGGALSVSLGGTIRSMASTGGSLVSGDGFATWSSGAEGELVLNDKVGLGVDGVRGNRATLSVWPAP